LERAYTRDGNRTKEPPDKQHLQMAARMMVVPISSKQNFPPCHHLHEPFLLLFIIASTIFPSVVSAKLPKKQTVIIINTSTTHLERKILKNCFHWINMFSATAIFSATKQQHEVWFLSKIWTRQKVHTLDSRARLSPQTSRDFFLIDLFLFCFFYFSEQDLQQRLRAFQQSVTNET
jgi:hypothetical protein